MQVDFYQLSRDPVERVLPQIARRILDNGDRLLVVVPDPDQRARVSEALWHAIPASFLAHGEAGEAHAASQPILLGDDCTATNAATHVAICDGQWRSEALGFARAFHFFDDSVIDRARDAWRLLSRTPDVEPRFWRQDGGRWAQVA